jgi:hypothetical protein
MTKTVRIENADTSDHKVIVFAEFKNDEGEWERTGEVFGLNYPTALAHVTIWKEKRIVIEEIE